MTDDFIIFSDAELDQVSGGDNPYAPPAQTHYHGPVRWYGSPALSQRDHAISQSGLLSRRLTPDAAKQRLASL